MKFVFFVSSILFPRLQFFQKFMKTLICKFKYVPVFRFLSNFLWRTEIFTSFWFSLWIFGKNISFQIARKQTYSVFIVFKNAPLFRRWLIYQSVCVLVICGYSLFLYFNDRKSTKTSLELGKNKVEIRKLVKILFCCKKFQKNRSRGRY